MRLIVLLLAGCFLLCGCGIKYKAMGVFPDSNETFTAEVDQNIVSGVAHVTAFNDDGLRCTGTSRVTYYPSNAFSCTGQRGDMELVCTDGRNVYVRWQAESCTSGFGSGKDSEGNRVVIAFGGDEASLKSRVGIGSSTTAKKPKSKGGGGTGTGFFISRDGLLATNFHVVEGCTEFIVYNKKDREAISAELLHGDPFNDIAILKVDMKTRPLPLAARAAVMRGDEVLTLGYPSPDLQGLEQKATFGRVNALSGIRDDARYLQVDLPIQPGNSGGPLINAKGEVIGIVSASLRHQKGRAAPQNVNYALKVDYMHPLLQMLPSPVKPSAGKPGMSMPQLVQHYEDSVIFVLSRP